MFSELVTIEMGGVERIDLIYGSVERDACLKGGKNIGYGISVRARHQVAINNESGVTIEE